jgi:hypothetical protein
MKLDLNSESKPTSRPVRDAQKYDSKDELPSISTSERWWFAELSEHRRQTIVIDL